MSTLLTTPAEMYDLARRFTQHSSTVQQISNGIIQASENMSGASWSGSAQMASHETVGTIHKATTNIVNLLNDAAERLKHNADQYVQQEEDARKALAGA